MVIDFTYHLSRESLARRANPMKEIRKLVLTGDRPLESFTTLSNGNVHPSLFAVSKLDFQVPDMGLPDNIVDNWRNVCTPSKLLSIGLGQDPSPLAIPVALQYSLGRGTDELISTLQELNTRIHPNLTCNCVTLHSGNADGVTKLYRLLLNHGDSLLVEEFSYPGTTNSLTALGVRSSPIKVDQFGIIPEDMEYMLESWDESKEGRRPHVLYLIPCGQNPTGGTLPLERRKRIYELAQKWDVIIIEDDPYYILQFSEAKDMINGHAVNGDSHPLGKLLPSFLSMDVDGRVIRMDTFSKTLAPGLRLGWFTSHPFFQKHLEWLTDDSVQHPNGFSQLFVAKLLSPAPQGWGFDGYIHWCEKLSEDYRKKRDLLLDSLKEELGEDWGVIASAETPVSGMFIRLYIPVEEHPLFERNDSVKGPKTNTREIVDMLFEALLEKGLVIIPGKTFAQPRDEADDIFDRCNFFRVTFSESDDSLRTGAKLFAEGVREFFSKV